jgi:hypothetical protein
LHKKTLKSGIKAQTGRYGTNNKRKNNGGISNQKRGSAKFAEHHSSIGQLTNESIAPINARNEIVICTAVEPLKETGDAYCLTVVGPPIFAVNNGVLVHNCADVVRGLLEYIHEARTKKPGDPLEQMIERLEKDRRIAPKTLNRFYANRL